MDLIETNKKTILCILPHYHMRGNANNVCILAILDELKRQGCQIDILCFDNDGNIPIYTMDNGYNIISITDEYNKVVYKYGKYFHATDWKTLPRYLKLFVKAKCYLKTIFRERTEYYPVDALSRKKILKTVKGIREHYDIILSHSFPFVSHVLATNIKKKMADLWYAVTWDPFVYNKLDPIALIEKRKKQAQRVLDQANKVFMLDGIDGENLKNEYNPQYQKNAEIIPLPTLKRSNNGETDSNEEETILNFSGALYADIRKPDDMLNVLSKFPKGYTLQLRGRGCRGAVKRAAEEFRDCRLVDYGMVSHQECMQAIEKSDFLVNIGNTITNQLPSKVFEYISSGKPIINFYSEEEDLGLKYFKKYPLCYNFYTRNYTEDDIAKLLAFCESNKGKRLTFEEATANLVEYRSENVCKKIVDIILS